MFSKNPIQVQLGKSQQNIIIINNIAVNIWFAIFSSSKFKFLELSWWSVHKDTDNQRLTNIYIFIIDFLELNDIDCC